MVVPMANAGKHTEHRAWEHALIKKAVAGRPQAVAGNEQAPSSELPLAGAPASPKLLRALRATLHCELPLT